jgi:3-hydroxybutyryl-CoA dehydrogenase
LPTTDRTAIDAARAIFEAAGLIVSWCKDRPGRIVDRLIRPQFNLALRAIDNDLATPDDLETALKIGLGYRRGLLNMVMDSGLELHFERTSALFETYGEAK